MRLLSHCPFLLHFTLGLQSQISDQTVDLAVALLLLVLEFDTQGLAVAQFFCDDLG